MKAWKSFVVVLSLSRAVGANDNGNAPLPCNFSFSKSKKGQKHDETFNDFQTDVNGAVYADCDPSKAFLDQSGPPSPVESPPVDFSIPIPAIGPTLPPSLPPVDFRIPLGKTSSPSQNPSEILATFHPPTVHPFPLSSAPSVVSGRINETTEETPVSSSDKPSSFPSLRPNRERTDIPSAKPSLRISSVPSEGPSTERTILPSNNPSESPSAFPSVAATGNPTLISSDGPSGEPSQGLSSRPSSRSSGVPSSTSSSPTMIPSFLSSIAPSSIEKSGEATLDQFWDPSSSPSESPSATPSLELGVGTSSIPQEHEPDAVTSTIQSDFPSLGPSSPPSTYNSNVGDASHLAGSSFVPSSSPTSDGQPSETTPSREAISPSDFASLTPSAEASKSRQPHIVPVNSPSPSFQSTLSGVPSNAAPSGESSNSDTLASILPSNFPSSSPSSAPPKGGSPGNSNVMPANNPEVEMPSRPSTTFMSSEIPSKAAPSGESSHANSLRSIIPSDYPSLSPSTVPSKGRQPGDSNVVPISSPSLGTPSALSRPSKLDDKPSEVAPSGESSNADSLASIIPSEFPSLIPSFAPSKRRSTGDSNVVPADNPAMQMPPGSSTPSRSSEIPSTASPSGKSSQVDSSTSIIPSDYPSLSPSIAPSKGRQPSDFNVVPISSPSLGTPSALSWPPNLDDKSSEEAPSGESSQNDSLTSIVPSDFPSLSPSSAPSKQRSSGDSHVMPVDDPAINIPPQSSTPSMSGEIPSTAVPSEKSSRVDSFISIIPSDYPSLSPSTAPSKGQQPGESDVLPISSPSFGMPSSPSVPSKLDDKPSEAAPSGESIDNDSLTSTVPSDFPSLSPSSAPSKHRSPGDSNVVPADNPAIQMPPGSSTPSMSSEIPSTAPSGQTSDADSLISILPSDYPSLSPSTAPSKGRQAGDSTMVPISSPSIGTPSSLLLPSTLVGEPSKAVSTGEPSRSDSLTSIIPSDFPSFSSSLTPSMQKQSATSSVMPVKNPNVGPPSMLLAPSTSQISDASHVFDSSVPSDTPSLTPTSNLVTSPTGQTPGNSNANATSLPPDFDGHSESATKTPSAPSSISDGNQTNEDGVNFPTENNTAPNANPSAFPSTNPSLMVVPTDSDENLSPSFAPVETPTAIFAGQTLPPDLRINVTSSQPVEGTNPTQSPPSLPIGDTTLLTPSPSLSSQPKPESAPSSMSRTNQPSNSPAGFSTIVHVPSVSPSVSPALPCQNMTTEQRKIQIFDNMMNLSGVDAFDDPEYPAYQAALWLADEDPLQLCPDETNIAQRYALALLYFFTSGDQWVRCTKKGLTQCRGDRFLSGSHECDWGGITCDSLKRVTKINLDENNMRGPIPVELQHLDYLEQLDLDTNSLTGHFPDWVGRMKYLESLDLDKNVLSGPIPDDLYESTTLQVVDIDRNILTGTISKKIGKMSQLYFFQVDFNQLIGTIPSEIANIPGLQYFSVVGNGFDESAGIPLDICGLNIQIYANCEMCTDVGDCCTVCLPAEAL